MDSKNDAWRSLREFSAEFVGTAVLLVIGISSSCVDKFNGSVSGGITVTLGWGLAVLFGVTISGGVSGGHLNPAVSFAFALSGDLTWFKFPIYCVAQITGAFFGACIAFGIYFEAFNSFDGGTRVVEGVNGTAGLFSTYPREFVTSSGAFVNEIFATALLLMLVLAIIDTKNMNISMHLMPSMVGLAIIMLNCSLCYNSGCAMNPARDLGPRLFTLVAGWGIEVFKYRRWNWFWVPLIGPMIGAPVGLYAYKIFIAFQVSKPQEAIDVSKADCPERKDHALMQYTFSKVPSRQKLSGNEKDTKNLELDDGRL